MTDTQPRQLSKQISQIPLWQAGQDGYHTYRIPALAVTNSGTILAFCEGRRDARSDTGKIDILVKRSTDNGVTWSVQQVIWSDGDHTCGNPAPVVDRDTGTIWLLTTWNRGDDHEREIIAQESRDTRRVFVAFSDDDGLTWAQPKEITNAVKQPNWTWYATGPGSGIQIEQGIHAGRLVIACDHIEAGTNAYYSHVIYSDDHGVTWQLGGRSPQDQVNESEVVELSDGRLLLNMRNYDREQHQRQIAFSHDGGTTWVDQRFDLALIEPICQASICRFVPSDQPPILLFANPASEAERVNMTVRASLDDGVTWALQQTLFHGPSAYSDLAICADDQAACLYECGDEHPYERIIFARFDLTDTRQE